MNREDVIRLAQEACINVSENNSFADDMYISTLYRFAALVAADEREACAQICTTSARRGVTYGFCAALIRARGNTNE
jgi:hypothetical protein